MIYFPLFEREERKEEKKKNREKREGFLPRLASPRHETSRSPMIKL